MASAHPDLSPETERGLDLHALRSLRQGSSRKPFREADAFEGVISEPATLHKYAFVHNDPVNHTDPTGMFSVADFAVTGGIIGGIVGFSAGTYIGYKNSGKLLSLETLGYGLLGLSAGVAVGALIGAGVGVLINGAIPFGSFNSIAKVTSKLIDTVAKGKLYRVTPVTFLAGVLAGVVTEYNAPNQFKDPIDIAVLLSLPTNTAALLIYNTVIRRVPGAAQETIAFMAGFNVGYFGARNLGELPDAIKHIPDLL